MDETIDERPTGCDREDCWAAAAKTVGLVLRTAGAEKVERHVSLGVQLCAAHAREASLDDFLDGKSWAAILRKFREEGLPHPTPKLTKLVLLDIEEE